MSEIAGMASRVHELHECNQDIAATELCTKNCRRVSAIQAQHDSHFNVHRHRLYQPLCLGCLRMPSGIGRLVYSMMPERAY